MSPPRRALKALAARLAAASWAWRGRRCLNRGDLRRAIWSLERALTWAPGAFRPWMDLARAYLRARDPYRASRSLARARETDARRFRRVVGGWLQSEGLTVETSQLLLEGLRTPEPSGSKVPAAARRPRHATRAVVAAELPYGDCQDLDEYARFQAMPPISRAERESVDWNRLLADLLED